MIRPFSLFRNISDCKLKLCKKMLIIKGTNYDCLLNVDIRNPFTVGYKCKGSGKTAVIII